MTTITREWLLQTIAEYEANRDELPFGLDTNSAIELQAFKIALASLGAEKIAEPVAKVETVGVCWYADNGVPRKPAVGTELYAAPPAPVTIDERAAFNAWNNEDNLPIAGVGAKNAAWLAWQARAKLGSPPAPVVPDEMTMADAIMEIDAKDADRWTGRIGFQKGWNACRTAMLKEGQILSDSDVNRFGKFLAKKDGVGI